MDPRYVWQHFSRTRNGEVPPPPSKSECVVLLKRASPYPKRDQRASHLADFDVVLTTYSTIMNESGSKGPGLRLLY